MGRITEEQKADVKYYANRKYEMDMRIAGVCNTRKEVDAIIQCIEVIKEDYCKYQYAVHSAPRDPKRRAKQFTNILDSCHTEDERLEELSYMKQMEPLSSQTMVIKDQIRDDITFILKSANIGKNRRKEIIPILLNNILLDGEL